MKRPLLSKLQPSDDLTPFAEEGGGYAIAREFALERGQKRKQKEKSSSSNSAPTDFSEAVTRAAEGPSGLLR